jgi:hypothetical protein
MCIPLPASSFCSLWVNLWKIGNILLRAKSFEVSGNKWKP